MGFKIGTFLILESVLLMHVSDTYSTIFLIGER